MVQPHRSRKSLAGRGPDPPDPLPQPQSRQLRRTDGLALAMDARRPHSRPPGRHLALRPNLLPPPLPRIHPRLLQRQRPPPLRKPRPLVRPARIALVPPGDHRLQTRSREELQRSILKVDCLTATAPPATNSQTSTVLPRSTP